VSRNTAPATPAAPSAPAPSAPAPSTEEKIDLTCVCWAKYHNRCWEFLAPVKLRPNSAKQVLLLIIIIIKIPVIRQTLRHQSPHWHHHELISSRTGSTASHIVIMPVSYSWIPRSACFIMQEVHFEPFYRRYIYFGAGACADSAVGGYGNICNHSGIYRSSHVVIRPIICITFKYIRFHIATRRFYPFSYRKDQYLGPVRPVWPVRCFVTPYHFTTV